MLLPNTNWFWYSHDNELRLDLGDTLTFVVPFALGQVVVIEQDGTSATCMLISDEFAVSHNKTLSQFDIIKVMNDRLIPYLADIPVYKRA